MLISKITAPISRISNLRRCCFSETKICNLIAGCRKLKNFLYDHCSGTASRFLSNASRLTCEVAELALQVHSISLQRLAILGNNQLIASVPLRTLHSFSALETLFVPLRLLHNVDEPPSGLIKRLHELLPSNLKCLMIDCTYGADNNPWIWMPASWNSYDEWVACLNDWAAPWATSMPGLQGVCIVFDYIYLPDIRGWEHLCTMFKSIGSQLSVLGRSRARYRWTFSVSLAVLLKSWSDWSRKCRYR
jgi:hypothetical protein